MARPFVILVPEPERERLRTAGIIPQGMFRSFNANTIGAKDYEEDGRTPILHLWPYDVCYDVTHYKKSIAERRPLDISAFFGIDPALDESQKRHNERLITRLLGSVLVHIVFLDKRIDEHGYAVFRSFREIAEWGWCLKDALDLRFRNEDELQARENVLVIVARGEQVSATQSELRLFEECVGRDRIFTSCYFLDYNLRVGETMSLFHSADVWDVAVGRLLLAFLLSQPMDAHGCGCWQRPGIKLWRAMDCSAEIAQRVSRRLLDEALNSASIKIHELLASDGVDDHEKSVLLAEDLKTGQDVNDAVEKMTPAVIDGDLWRREPSGGWSEFDALACARKTRDIDGSRWKACRDRIRRIFPMWRHAQRCDSCECAARGLVRAVHGTPGRLFAFVKGLLARLAERDANVGSPGEKWASMMQASRAWHDSVLRLEADSVEFEKSQRHYVGWGVGLLLFMSVSLMFGWVIHRLVYALGPMLGLSSEKVLVASLVLFGFLAFGAFSAVVLMVGCHCAAGRRGLKGILSESAEADALMQHKDEMTRDLVRYGMLRDSKERIRATRLRVWSLLKRLESMILVEMQIASPTVVAESQDKETDGSPNSSNMSQTEGESVRADFLSRTRRTFGPYVLSSNREFKAKVAEVVQKWWDGSNATQGSPGGLPTNFAQLWKSFAGIDQEESAYYPSHVVVPEMRSFVARFLDDVRLLAGRAVVGDHIDELREGLFRWFESVVKTDVALYCSAAITPLHVNERRQSSPIVYFADNNALVQLDRIEASARETRTIYGPFRTLKHPILSLTTHLALMYQEFVVRFECDECLPGQRRLDDYRDVAELGGDGDKVGNLTFKELSDA